MSLNVTTNDTMQKLNILYYNARSILPKLDHLSLSVKLYEPHIICITKSWLSKDISGDELSLPGYQLFRLDRDRHGGGGGGGGGGGLMYVSLLFTVTPHPLPSPALELISLSVYPNKEQFCIIMCFLSPT